jgi:hypothetical protein
VLRNFAFLLAGAAELLVEPGLELAGGFPGGVGARLPLDGGAALAGECLAVVGAVVDEHGVGEAQAVGGQPGAEEPLGSSLLRVPAWLEQMMSSQMTAQSARGIYVIRLDPPNIENSQ